MRGKNPILDLKVLPDYHSGFAFEWDISPAFAGPLPWEFYLDESQHPNGGWIQFAGPLEGASAYVDSAPRFYTKARQAYFRLRLVSGADEWTSKSVMPYASMSDRRDWLQAREIMRNEVVQARMKTGVEVDVYLRAIRGPRCTECVDPITGAVVDKDCDTCYGTGTIPGYFGAYPMWAVFSPTSTRTALRGDQTGPASQFRHSARMVGSLTIRSGSVIADNTSGKRYVVGAVESVAELRRVPLVQNLHLSEAPVSDTIYMLEDQL